MLNAADLRTKISPKSNSIRLFYFNFCRMSHGFENDFIMNGIFALKNDFAAVVYNGLLLWHGNVFFVKMV